MSRSSTHTARSKLPERFNAPSVLLSLMVAAIIKDASVSSTGKNLGCMFSGKFKNLDQRFRSEEHTSELQSLMRISYAVFCLKKKTNNHNHKHIQHYRIVKHRNNYK